MVFEPAFFLPGDLVFTAAFFLGAALFLTNFFRSVLFAGCLPFFAAVFFSFAGFFLILLFGIMRSLPPENPCLKTQRALPEKETEAVLCLPATFV